MDEMLLRPEIIRLILYFFSKDIQNQTVEHCNIFLEVQNKYCIKSLCNDKKFGVEYFEHRRFERLVLQFLEKLGFPKKGTCNFTRHSLP